MDLTKLLEFSFTRPQVSEAKSFQGSIRDYFRYATSKDIFVFNFGLFLAFIHGATIAIFACILGLIVDCFGIRNQEKGIQQIYLISLTIIGLGFCVFLGTYGSQSLFKLISERQTTSFRASYMKAILSRELSAPLSIDFKELTEQVDSDCLPITKALESGFGSLTQKTGTIVVSIIVSLVRSYYLSMVILISIPCLSLALFLFHKKQSKAQEARLKTSKDAGAIMENALNNIRKVVALGAERFELLKYNGIIAGAQRTQMKAGAFQGLALGVINLVFFLAISSIFYIGSLFIRGWLLNPKAEARFTIGDILTSTFAAYLCAINLTPVPSILKIISSGKQNARKILRFIEETKNYEGQVQKNKKRESVSITLRNVSLNDPTNTRNIVLHDLNLHIRAHTVVAFAGADLESRKNALIRLFQKGYDLCNGTIEFNGVSKNTIGYSWFRGNVAYISQEPVLFSLSARENLLLAKEDATEEEIIQVLKNAGAYDFLLDLQKTIDTPLDLRVDLSAAQKQKIAIACAILRGVSVLVIDEAISASQELNEKEMRGYFKELTQYMTVIVIANNGSTIQEADQVVILKDGRIEDIGKFEELIGRKERYSDQATTQNETDCNMEFSQQFESSTRTYEADRTRNMEDELEASSEECSLLRDERSLSRYRDEKMDYNEKVLKAKEETSSTLDNIIRLWKLGKFVRRSVLLGWMCCIINALLLPVSQFILGEMTNLLSKRYQQHSHDMVKVYCLYLFIVAITSIALHILQMRFFVQASETFTQTLHSQIFYKFLRMHIGWHDSSQNNPKALNSTLQNSLHNIGQFASITLSIYIQTGGYIITSVALLAFIRWELIVASLILMLPIGLGFVIIRSKEKKDETRSKVMLQEANKIIYDVFTHLDSISCPNALNLAMSQYNQILKKHYDARTRSGMLRSFFKALLYLILFAELAGLAYFSLLLHNLRGLTVTHFATMIFTVLFIAMYLQQLNQLIPNTVRPMASLEKIFEYLDLRSLIDIEIPKSNLRNKIKGNIEFRNVSFRYPGSEEFLIRNVSFKLEAGQRFQIIVPNECVKLAILELLIRLYDVEEGKILIDGIDIQEYDLKYLRSNIGVIYENPFLFSETVEFNLKYGNQHVSYEDMKEAIKKSGVLLPETKDDSLGETESDFLGSLTMPSTSLSFQNLVQSKQGLMTIAQRQRMGIARVYLRKPKIFVAEGSSYELTEEEGYALRKTLKKVSKGCTLVRLVRDSNVSETSKILVMEES